MRDENNEITQIKIADLGNACWVDKHFTDDIQTRQYRSPEVILGCSYDASADMWSLACLVFELATGDLLFKPKKGKNHGKSDDHLALIMELLGIKRLPAHLLKGKRAKEFVTPRGELCRIKKLKIWTLEDVFLDKYSFSKSEAAELGSFLGQFLCLKRSQRATAAQALLHPWLSNVECNVPFPTAGE